MISALQFSVACMHGEELLRNISDTTIHTTWNHNHNIKHILQGRKKMIWCRGWPLQPMDCTFGKLNWGPSVWRPLRYTCTQLILYISWPTWCTPWPVHVKSVSSAQNLIPWCHRAFRCDLHTLFGVWPSLVLVLLWVLNLFYGAICSHFCVQCSSLCIPKWVSHVINQSINQSINHTLTSLVTCSRARLGLRPFPHRNEIQASIKKVVKFHTELLSVSMKQTERSTSSLMITIK